jgi:hypothetical protein
MRKGVSQIDLQNAFSGLSHEVAAGRIGRKTASTLAYLGLVLFQSDQMITENEFRAAAGPPLGLHQRIFRRRRGRRRL